MPTAPSQAGPADLYLLDTPLQLLNAIEVRHRFPALPADLVLLEWPHWPADAFAGLLERVPWRAVRRVPMEATGPAGSGRLAEYRWTWRQCRRRRRLDRALAGAGPVERLVVGNLLSEFMRYGAARLPHRELIAVDDGTDTLRVAEQRLNPTRSREAPPLSRGPVGEFKARLRRQYVECDGPQPPAVVFFTAYQISLKSGDRLLKNDYPWLRGEARPGQRDPRVYFLGQPLVEDGYLSQATYLDYLARIHRHLGPEGMVYVPHKRESARMVALVQETLQVPVQRFAMPIEVALSLQERLPRALASFFCSALVNCSILFGGLLPSTAYYLPPRVLLDGHDCVEDCYRYFRHSRPDALRVVEV